MGQFDINKETQAGLNQVYSDAASSSADKEYQGLLRGTDQANQFRNSDNSFNAGVNFNDSGMLDAVKARANKGYNLDRGRFDIDTKRMAQANHQEKLANASKLAADEAQMNLQKEIMAARKRAAKRRARGGVLSSVLGIGGAITGGMIPGAGAVGVMAGSQIGSGLGGMLSGGGE